MAVITSAATGNFSAPGTWVGGVVPGVNDDAVAANGTVVTIDTDVTVLSFQQAGTGKFVLGNGRAVTGNVIANAGTFTSGGTVEVTATSTAVINGNISGVSSTASNIAAVVITGSGTLTINGSITGSANNNTNEAGGSSMVYTNTTNTLNVNGSVTGGGEFKRCIHLAASSNTNVTVVGNMAAVARESYAIFALGASHTITVTGSVSGGTGSSGFGISSRGVSNVITITGNLTGGGSTSALAVYTTGSSAVVTVVGNVTGGTGGSTHGILTQGASSIVNITGNVSATGASTTHGIYSSGLSSTITVIGTATAASTTNHAIRSDATANGVVFQGNLIDSSQGATAVWSRLFRLTATNNGYTQYTNTVGYPNGTPVTRVSPDLVTGMPAESNVRNGTVYGYNSELTGTMNVPPAGSVNLGVPVDNTTGTAALDVGTIIAVTGAQVAAASSNPSVV